MISTGPTTAKPPHLQTPEWSVLSDLFPSIHHLPETDTADWSHQNFSRGDYLFRPGERCKRFVLLGEGRIRLQIVNTQGRRITLYRVLPGQLCLHSLINLINQDDFSFEAVAESAGWLSWTSADRFSAWMNDSHDFREWILASFGERLKQMLNLNAELAFSSVEQRLADHLLEQMGEDGSVCATQAALAAEIGSAREVVLRTLQRWEKRGWIIKSRGTILVNDIEALLDFLETGVS